MPATDVSHRTDALFYCTDQSLAGSFSGATIWPTVLGRLRLAFAEATGRWDGCPWYGRREMYGQKSRALLLCGIKIPLDHSLRGVTSWFVVLRRLRLDPGDAMTAEKPVLGVGKGDRGVAYCTDYIHRKPSL